MKTVVKRIAFLLPLLLVWAIPVALILFTFQKVGQTESEALSTPLPKTVDVGTRERAYTEGVRLTMKYDEEPSAVLPAGGTVTGIDYKPEASIKHGDALITIDGITRRALRDVGPFHRDLSRGDQGPDVKQLAEYLTTALDQPVQTDVGDKFGYRMTEAVKRYQKANGAPTSGVFEPGYVIYLTDEITRFGEPTVRIGDQVNEGDDFATPSETVAGAKIEAQEGSIKTAAVPGPYVLEVQDVIIELEDFDLDVDEATEINETLIEAGIPFDEGEDPTERSIQGVRVAVQNPIEVATVVPGAIYASPTGQLCIFEAETDSENLDGTAIPLTEASGLDGDTSISAIDLEHAGKTVVRAPQTLPAQTLAECS